GNQHEAHRTMISDDNAHTSGSNQHALLRRGLADRILARRAIRAGHSEDNVLLQAAQKGDLLAPHLPRSRPASSSRRQRAARRSRALGVRRLAAALKSLKAAASRRTPKAHALKRPRRRRKRRLALRTSDGARRNRRTGRKSALHRATALEVDLFDVPD